jgi:hypothetical protein
VVVAVGVAVGMGVAVAVGAMVDVRGAAIVAAGAGETAVVVEVATRLFSAMGVGVCCSLQAARATSATSANARTDFGNF